MIILLWARHADVWEAVSAIGRLDVWFPIIETCKIEGHGAGAIRWVTLINGGGEITDTIEEIDPVKKAGVSTTCLTLRRDLL